MSATHALVEHFFRREAGRLTAVAARWLGVGRLELAEDVVQAALVRALETWGRRGVPDDPAGWLLRTAKNLAVDALRRERRRTDLESEPAAPESDFADPTFDDEIGDESLRLLFVCCHDAVPMESRVALALKTLGGFDVPEIARALLTAEANIRKRLARAKETLRQEPSPFADLTDDLIAERAEAVQSVVYLMFNEGCYASHSEEPIRRDLCDEALRLATMLASHPKTGTPAACALAGLLCFHAARLESRVGADGVAILLDRQDRSRWDWNLARAGMDWMAKSARGDELTKYHLESAIAWEHVRAPTFADTDWPRIVQLYAALQRVAPSMPGLLNWAVAESYVHGPKPALARLVAAHPAPPRNYPIWSAVVGELHFRAGEPAAAETAWLAALRDTHSAADRELLRRRLADCRKQLWPGRRRPTSDAESAERSSG
jgi:RNA polymerase sigma-70 factor (ECF subfamily)